MFQSKNLVGRLGRIENLEKHHAVDRQDRVVLGDDFLGGHIHNTFHHDDLVAHAIDERNDEMKTGPQRGPIPAESFQGVLVALANDDDRLANNSDSENGGNDRPD